ncbi:MAG TPA: energy transducer TonB [Terriglobales bacterium]|nr:energy transducer TonB [Terriglobales bacterium]
MYASDELQFGLLPERKVNWRSLAASYGLEVLFILFLATAGAFWPSEIQLRQRQTIVDLVPPSVELSPAPIRLKTLPHITAKLLPPAPMVAPKLIVPKEFRPAPKEVAEAPKVVMNTFKPVVLEQSGARQAKLLYTGSFGSTPMPTVNAAVEKVQTGGFGDPTGLRGEGKANAHMEVAKVGGFDLPQGQGTGNGTGGANGIKGTISSAGFGSGVAQPGQGDGRSNGRGVQTGGFGAQQIAQNVRPQQQVQSGATTPVEITFKPKPVYTSEARQLRLEGEVLLEVMFGARGDLKVNRVVRGLGHGLDEAAVDAANKMRFKPAMRDGVAVDSTAVVHVSFQMAF